MKTITKSPETSVLVFDSFLKYCGFYFRLKMYPALQ